MLKNNFLIACLLLSFYSNAQTCIVILRLKDDILIGTDSKRGGVSYPVCKIRKYRDIFISIAGANSEPVYATALDITKKDKDINTIADDFKKIEKLKYKLFLDSFYKKDRKNFVKNFNRLKGLSISFCGFENYIPKIILVEFNATMNKDEHLLIKDTVFKLLSPPTVPITEISLGHNENIEKRLSNDANFFSGKDIVESIETLIRIECKASPDFVGEPINVLQIFQDEEGYKWLKNPTKCDF